MLLFLFFLGLSMPGFGSNVQVTNSTVVSAQSLGFELAWDNAWNLQTLGGPGNHDAIWVFAKMQEGSGPWQHVSISANPADHTLAGNRLLIETQSDEKGVFVRLANPDSGTVAPTNIELGLSQSLPAGGGYRIRIFAIEMVHIPEGSFELGDGASNHTFRRGNAAAPFAVLSESPITIGTGATQLFDGGANPPGGTIPEPYPKGFAAVYCMKYELSQIQYADFLNTLTYAQQTAIVSPSLSAGPGTFALTSSNRNRNDIEIAQPAFSTNSSAVFGCDANNNDSWNEAGDGQNRACNWVPWWDLLAYLDWAALRPMTELEYEKIGRGPVPAVPLEFAWGTDLVTDANTLSNDGTSTETAIDTLALGAGLASHGYAGPQGPLRCGFPGPGRQGRLATGASYYGVAELSGNMWEQCISANAVGLQFTGQLGDGSLNADGSHNVSDWPGTTGGIYRGGGWNSGVLTGFRDLALSDRFYAGTELSSARNTTGGRGVR